ncbi:Hyaluronidase-2 [Oryzias melastigma]|uniref:Hyaluronidase n=1 Tax=Oryzias melastigma TaxID=30732 RepID=A0A3B3BND2_ORYME|nr:Hyaluronidase-2 [Oryzias melastigma]
MACTKAHFHPDPQPEPKPTAFSSAASLLLLLFLGLFACPCRSAPPQPARPPLLSGQPFIIFWGILDSSCSNRADARSFGMERERIAVFYEDTLGSYPYFVDKNTPVNKGLPQHTRLNSHIQKLQQDLDAALPSPRYLGLGVLRWAEWLPQWSRNREKQAMYQDASRKLMKSFFPKWTPEEVEKWSKVDFEAAAQSVMMESLREVKRLRPKALWGFSPYPSCNNNDPTQTVLGNYSGQCTPAEAALNDQLLWLWKRCSALYPLLTLDKLQSGTPGARLSSSGQIREALRVSSLAGRDFDLPVFPLVKSVYASTKTFLSQTDLVNTIGESAAMGTAGIVIWDKSEPKTERECQDLAEFVQKVLGPYFVNITTATQLCSASLCQGRGRCVRLDPDSSAYLHLPPSSTAAGKVAEKVGKGTVQSDKDNETAEPDPAEIWKKDFQCQWYKTAGGDASDQQAPRDGAESEVDAGGVTAASAAKSASDTKFRRTDPPDTGNSKPSLEAPTDSVASLPADPNVMVLLGLVAGSLCLRP